ncbi:DNA-deoxyinosine glycosylase [Pandoraea pneumonica]|jgi:hypoxanthine-DNA glycosylase|uniref:DNA-deoxyinosine glycosylase n=1 Tax=Pandoraea pneumonica TaxID=2508299 RepID=A0A5E4TMD9_9BURK|nr:DNA-deoxyinosine glycosylase [Pandoraea pneumonica]VVD88967.1 DNA-deoxyinosine glycosylase [Pandoraea pneumonica]
MSATSPDLKRNFPPVVDANTRVLILGSLPGEVSLAHQQYYAHPQNRFWHLVGEVIGEPLPALDYAARLDTVRAHGIGLWDVVAEARREGSLDSNIRLHAGSDLVGLIATLPSLRAVAFNGGTAARIGQRALAQGDVTIPVVLLPSSSPAYTIPYATKRDAWLALRDFVSATPLA